MKKISIIVPCYETEQYVEKCINSLLKQTYKNLEIIAVNDCSKGNMQEILERISETDNRVKVINNEVDKGLLHTRIVGSKEATGDYIAFIDSNDYVDIDFYRLLINNIEEKKSDISIGNIVFDKEKEKLVSSLTYNSNNKVFESKELLDEYYKQTGRNERYHLLKNKLIKIEVWKKVLKAIGNNNDVINKYNDIFLTALCIYNSNKISYCDNAICFTRRVKTDKKKIINSNIESLTKVFKLLKDHLKSSNILDKYQRNIEVWEAFYLYEIVKKVKSKDNLDIDVKSDKRIKLFEELLENDKSWNNYNEVLTAYNDEFSKIKQAIAKEDIEIVSFDMFDTLVVRPFLVPADMFTLLNDKFKKTFNKMSVIDFGLIRPKSEMELRREKIKEHIEDVTLDQIYDYISKQYDLNKEKLEVIKQAEIDMEIHFCYRRNSGYELYSLAKELGKKVILTSDIYLPREVLLKILEKNGYKFDEYYISCELLKTKCDGDIFEYIKEQEKTKKIVHIGDNYISDYTRANEHGLIGKRLYKASDVMFGATPITTNNFGYLYKFFASFNIDHIPYELNSGVRCAIGMVANYYFDNPFRPFNDLSDFNSDPYLIGYYTLGMQTLSMCKWLIEDAKKEKIDSISFMARDGYVPYKAMKIFTEKTNYSNKVDCNYVYVSRKSLMPLLLKDKVGISMIDTYVNYFAVSPKDLLKQLDRVLEVSEEKEKIINEKFPIDKEFKDVDTMNKCLSLIYDTCYSKEKYDKYYKMCKKYFDDNFTGNAATFDVGYSGKPEAIISSVLEKPVTTYFIHTNDSQGQKNAHNSDFKLKCFFDFKPTISGALRELFISFIGPSCIGYKYDNDKVLPVFDKEKIYSYYNNDMILKIQSSAIDFVSDYCDFFADYMDSLDINKYYMSIPLEYYYHYAKTIDTYPIKNLLFEANVNVYVEMNEFILDIKKNYTAEYCRGDIPSYKNAAKIDYTLPNSRFKRIIYYIFKDREQLKLKIEYWKKKEENPELMPNSKWKRLVYYLLFNRKKLVNKILKKDN